MKISFNKRYTTIALYAAILILFSIVCINIIIVRPVGLFSLWDSIRQIIKTIFYAVVIAYIMAPIMDFFHKKVFKFIQKKKEFSIIRKVISLVVTFLIFFAVITVIVWYIAPKFIANIEALGKVMTSYYNSIDQVIKDLCERSDLFNNIYSSLVQSESGKEVSLSEIITQAIGSLLSVITNASSYIITFITTFVNEVKNVLIGIFLSIYLVYYKEMLFTQIAHFGKAFLRPNTRKYIAHVIDDINIKFAKFLRGKALDSTIVGFVLYILYKIVGMPYAEIFAVIGGVMNMVPVFGPIIASFSCGFILLITQPQMLITYIIIVAVVGLLDSNLLEPKMLGDSLGLKPVWITIAIIVMSSLFGFFGMFFGVPIFAVIYTLVEEAINNRVSQREAREAYEEAHKAAQQADESSTKDNDENSTDDSSVGETEKEEDCPSEDPEK